MAEITQADIQAAIDETRGDNAFLAFCLSVAYEIIEHLLERIKPKIRFYHWWGIKLLLKALRWYLAHHGWLKDEDGD